MRRGLPRCTLTDTLCPDTTLCRSGWLDLSTGINPVSYPLPPLADEVWKRLPDARLDSTARIAAAECYGVDEPDLIVPAPGTQALIQALQRLTIGRAAWRERVSMFV